MFAGHRKLAVTVIRLSDKSTPTMTEGRWQKLEALFHAALEHEPESRQAFLNEACAEDADLREQVERLLGQEQQAGRFLEHPAFNVTATSGSAASLMGQRFGPYRIVSLLGSGGMGEVYQAHDSRLNRSVAVKVCAAEFSGRFPREARAIAALNHPHICQLYDVGPNYLVMELVEGPTLAERIQQGPVPLEQALVIAKQIAEAVETAHEKGIVHRDLKPGNIKLRPDGTVKVLDFGLAKMTETTDVGRPPEDSPTFTLEAATGAGTILGTAAYMSPEQALGKGADKRADIWSFGAVLYEMLGGRRAFMGESASEVVAAVLKLDPDWSALPKKTPVAIRELIRRCLTKDRRQRLQAIGDARIVIEEYMRRNAPEMAEPAPAGRRIVLLAVAAGGLAIALIAVSWMAWRATRPTNRPLVRLDIDLGPEAALPNSGGDSHNVILSPDGARLVYVSGKPSRLFTRRMDQSKANGLPGTDDADHPFFSPDGQWVGFFSGRYGTKLNKISVEGGAVVPLADLGAFSSFGDTGGSWGADGNIIVGIGNRGLFRVPASGGALTTILELAPGELDYDLPQILLGGKAVLFENLTGANRNTFSIEAFSFADRRRKILVRGGTNPYYLPSGYLIYTNDATLFAISFDVNRLETRGTAVPILEDVAYYLPPGGADLTFSQTGALIYRRGGAIGAPQMSTIQWLDGAGKREPLLAKPGDYSNPRISPDGTRLALIADQNIWVYDLRRDAMTRLTFEHDAIVGYPMDYDVPVWSPDGRFVVFSEANKGIYWTRANGAGQPQPLTHSKNIQIPWSFTPDGKRLAYYEFAGKGQIWTLPLERQDGQLNAGKPEQFLKSQSNDLTPAFSPDGHWLSYESDASGRYEVYVRAFPPPASRQAGQWQISNTGTLAGPAWSRNGRELIYLSGDQLMAVSYSINGDSFVAGKPRVWIGKPGGTGWDLAPDGKRVAVVTPVTAPEALKPEHEVVLLLNFFDELRRRVPLK